MHSFSWSIVSPGAAAVTESNVPSDSPIDHPTKCPRNFGRSAAARSAAHPSAVQPGGGTEKYDAGGLGLTGPGDPDGRAVPTILRLITSAGPSV
jgi:hypothetical protein